MTDLSSEYWNNRYLTNNFGWDIGYPSTPLCEYFNQLSDKSITILIPGAGNGYEAELLFELGFKNIFVLDFAQEPLNALKRRLPDFPHNQLLHTDFFQYNGKFDLIIEQTFFCAIDPVKRKEYVTHMHQLLKPDGKLVGLLFDDPMNSDHPPFGGNEAEYRCLFQDDFYIKLMAPCFNSIKPRQGKELFVIMQPMPLRS